MYVLNAFPSKVRNEAGLSALTIPIQQQGNPSPCNKAGKGNRRCVDWKGRSKLSLFAGHMIVYVKNSKEFTTKGSRTNKEVKPGPRSQTQ